MTDTRLQRSISHRFALLNLRSNPSFGKDLDAEDAVDSLYSLLKRGRLVQIPLDQLYPPLPEGLGLIALGIANQGTHLPPIFEKMGSHSRSLLSRCAKHQNRFL